MIKKKMKQKSEVETGPLETIMTNMESIYKYIFIIKLNL